MEAVPERDYLTYHYVGKGLSPHMVIDNADKTLCGRVPGAPVNRHAAGVCRPCRRKFQSVVVQMDAATAGEDISEALREADAVKPLYAQGDELTFTASGSRRQKAWIPDGDVIVTRVIDHGQTYRTSHERFTYVVRVPGVPGVKGATQGAAEGELSARERKPVPKSSPPVNLARQPKVAKPLSDLREPFVNAGATRDPRIGAGDGSQHADGGAFITGRDMTGAMPRERSEGAPPVPTTLDRPLGRMRNDISVRTDRKILPGQREGQTVQVVSTVVGGAHGWLPQTAYDALSRTHRRRYDRLVAKRRSQAGEARDKRAAVRDAATERTVRSISEAMR